MTIKSRPKKKNSDKFLYKNYELFKSIYNQLLFFTNLFYLSLNIYKKNKLLNDIKNINIPK